MSPRPFMLAGCIIAAVGFGGFMAWAATAEIASAVIAQGVVSVESARKTIAHLEGGIVEKVHVRDGLRVKAGDVLISLSPIQSAASLDMLVRQRSSLLATRARLEAEVAGSTPNFPRDVDAAAVVDQMALYNSRKEYLEQQLEALDVRIASTQEQIEALSRRISTLASTASSFREQLSGAKELAAKGLKPQNEVRAMEREILTVESSIGETRADMAVAETTIAEAKMQRVVLVNQFRQEATAELAKTNEELAKVEEQIRVAEDEQNRTEIRAPQDGIVQSLMVHAAGAVIPPGQPVAELVPIADDLVVTADVPSLQIDQIYAGMKTEIRFPSFNAATTPVINGHVVAMSGDAVPDAEGRRVAHKVEVAVDVASIPAELRERLMPGMPAVVVAPTQERTVISYLLRPLEDALTRAMRER